LFVGFPLGFAASGVFSGLGAYLSELFPSEVRATGQGFSYNFGRLVGAAFPMLVGRMAKSMPLGEAISLFAGVAYGVLILVIIFLPETKHKKLGNFSDLPDEHTPLTKSTIQ
jgi:MFS family permease